MDYLAIIAVVERGQSSGTSREGQGSRPARRDYLVWTGNWSL